MSAPPLALEPAGAGARGWSVPWLDHVWRVRGAVPVDPALAPEEAFARLDPLLRTPGTHLAVEGGALVYAKHNPAAQDRLATFTRGRLWIERAGAGAVLRYDLFSHALLLCFLAPLLFLGFAQIAVSLNAWEKASEAVEAKAKDKKEEEKPKPVRKLHPVDEFLGAPAPEDPDKKKDEKKEDEEEGRHDPAPGYALAGLFLALYLLGRWLEPWLARRRFRAALAGPAGAPAQSGG